MPDFLGLIQLEMARNDCEFCTSQLSKTVIVKNCGYYGWVKASRLRLSRIFFEDFASEHRRYSIHGSFVDFGGRGIAIIGPSGSGKTTLTYGLLLGRGANFVTDDWFFVRLMGEDTLVFLIRKEFYIRDDLAHNWPTLAAKLHGISQRMLTDARLLM